MTERDVCAVDELPPGAHRVVRVGRFEVGVFNVDGEFVAVRNRCPHAGAPLCHTPLTGTVVSDAPRTRRLAHEGRILRCPWHGWEFLMPEARTLVEPAYTLTTYDVRVRDGRVVVDTGGAGPMNREGTALAGADDPSSLMTVTLADAVRGGTPPPGPVVDASVHVRPRDVGELRRHLPDVWRSRRLPAGDGYYYPNPAGAHLRDAFPASGPPGSDPDLLYRHLVTDGGADVVVLHPLTLGLLPDIDLLVAICAATNAWLAESWLGEHNAHGRYRGILRVAPGDPVAAVAEIERWAGHPGFVAVGVPTQSLQPYGKRAFWPVWSAAAAHGLPVVVHADAETGVELAPTPAGYLHTHLGHAALSPMRFVDHLASLVVEGVLDHLPSLRVVFADGGFDLLAPMTWRMDKDYRAMRPDMPWTTRLPSAYLEEQVRFVTHRMDGPADPATAEEWTGIAGAERLLVYGSNYPEWDFLPPQLVAPYAPDPVRDRIVRGNAEELFEGVRR